MRSLINVAVAIAALAGVASIAIAVPASAQTDSGYTHHAKKVHAWATQPDYAAPVTISAPPPEPVYEPEYYEPPVDMPPPPRVITRVIIVRPQPVWVTRSWNGTGPWYPPVQYRSNHVWVAPQWHDPHWHGRHW